MKNNKVVVRPLALAVMMSLIASAGAVGNGTVVSGTGNIVKSGSQVNVNQNSNKMIIKWDNMNVGRSETLNFKQASNASVLNRINSIDPTVIAGRLNASGSVFIVNPNGVLISNGAAVNVGSLVASSLDINNRDFNAGKLNFKGDSKGKVINNGNINAKNTLAMIGTGEVTNNGMINAAGGASLAAGSDITLYFPSMGKMAVKINRGSLNALINNGGMIVSDQGTIALNAWATDYLTRGVINNKGTLEATGFSTNSSNSIYLSSQGNGDISLAGALINGQGSIKVASNQGVNITNLNVSGKGKTDVIAQDDVITNGYMLTAGDLNVSADHGSVKIDSANTNGKLAVKAGRDLRFRSLYGKGTVDLAATNILGEESKYLPSSISSDTSVTINANNKVDFGVLRGREDPYNPFANKNLLVNAGDINIDTVNTTGNTMLNADENISGSKGNINVTNMINQSGTANIIARNNIKIDSFKGNNLVAKADNGVLIDLLINNNASITSGGTVGINRAILSGDLAVASDGDMNFNFLNSNRMVDISAANIYQGADKFGGGGAISAKIVRLYASDNIDIGRATANTYYGFKNSGDIVLRAKDINVDGALTGHSMDIYAKNDVNISSVRAAADSNGTGGVFANVYIRGDNVNVDGGYVNGYAVVDAWGDSHFGAIIY